MQERKRCASASKTKHRTRRHGPRARPIDAEETERWKRRNLSRLARCSACSRWTDRKICMCVQGQPRWRKGVAHACARTGVLICGSVLSTVPPCPWSPSYSLAGSHAFQNFRQNRIVILFVFNKYCLIIN